MVPAMLLFILSVVRFGPVLASLILGTLHMLWHLPVYTYSGGLVPLEPFDLSTFALGTVLMAIMTISWTWVYNNSGGSILLAVRLHSSFNASGSLIGQLIPVFPHEATLLVNGAFVVIPLLLVFATRGRLSYREVPAGATAAAPEGADSGSRQFAA
jgi:hypothetical protein